MSYELREVVDEKRKQFHKGFSPPWRGVYRKQFALNNLGWVRCKDKQRIYSCPMNKKVQVCPSLPHGKLATGDAIKNKKLIK